MRVRNPFARPKRAAVPVPGARVKPVPGGPRVPGHLDPDRIEAAKRRLREQTPPRDGD